MDKIKQSQNIINNILNSNTDISFKNRTKYDLDKKIFEDIIINIERLTIRSSILIQEAYLDLTKYEEPYYFIIRDLFELLYPKEAIEIIYFYLYNRITITGEKMDYVDKNNNTLKLDSPGELFDIINTIKSNGK